MTETVSVRKVNSMCRMFGMVSARPVAVRALLHDAPRSLAALSNHHRDGWGIALAAADAWAVHRNTECAARCAQYRELVANANAELVVAHVRKKTVGPTSLANTHPFRSGDLVFAHNGTVAKIDQLVPAISARRLSQVSGDTDSEKLFAFILTRIDELVTVREGVRDAVRALHAIADVGSANFLLATPRELYAHRLGRSLFTLTRHADAANEQRRTPAQMVASEPLTDEDWQELPERSLVCAHQNTSPHHGAIEQLNI